MRSDIIKQGAERAPHRSLLRATGSIESEEDFNKPFIAICNSYTDCICLPETELVERKRTFQPLKRQLTGWLARYQRIVGNASQGGVLWQGD